MLPRPFCSGPRRHGRWAAFSSLLTWCPPSRRFALPLQPRPPPTLTTGTSSVLPGSRPAPPSPRSRLGRPQPPSPQDPLWLQRTSPWSPRHCHSVNLKQSQVNKNNVPTRSSELTKPQCLGTLAPLSAARPRPPGQSSRHSRPPPRPSPGPPAGLSLLLGRARAGHLFPGSGC